MKDSVKKDDRVSDNVLPNVVSTMDCTGMIQTPPLTEEEVDNYGDIYTIPQQCADNARSKETPSRQKAQGTIKKRREKNAPQQM